ncbi:hypothetical protein L228DRAFT_259674 [Xylona heveae TC161]|uniref:C3H1-type domain-containing protein n=1 Tax=Xylona heveae (strain CBS 132557 / TC161) TaxID=1328760 RepID=A0A165I6K3_XYLHT|nr:hypothetical protein L228DRAFT_259674 [Xylona heveae TC161]KZF24460.1 hypothetical protein L228DRAFT_259674 [Xylona heveae TC161]
MNSYDLAESELQANFEAFALVDTRRNELIQWLYKENCQLKLELVNLKADHEAQLRCRRDYQAQALEEREDHLRTKQIMEKNPFALLLIDGDGYIFHDELLKGCASGGAEAAHRLLSAAKDYVQKLSDFSGQWSIMVKIYANLGGLARKLVQIGSIKTVEDMTAFACGFTRHHALFDFVDVGMGKERADHKLRNLLDLFIHNHQCKHILFACTHDNGYVPVLDQYRVDEKLRSRVSLLNAMPMASGFIELPFRSVEFPAVFRSEPLPPPKPIAPPVAVRKPSAESNSISEPVSFASAAATALPAKTSSPVNGGLVIQVSGSTPKPKITMDMLGLGVILLNSEDQRVEPELGKYDPAVYQQSLRTNKLKGVCNKYHLLGTCTSSNCPFSHAKLTEEEKMVLRYNTRKSPCSYGLECRDFYCLYGHKCPHPVCHYGPTCSFKGMHRIDQKVAKKLEDKI